MKKIIGLLTFIGLLGLMSSCEEEIVNPGDIQEGQVAFIISDFQDAGTRSAFQTVDSKLKFQWSADDAIGIFPESGWQTEFSMEEGAGTSVAVFDGGSWGLKKDAVYYAYYPFSKENFESKDMRERVKYSYIGQEACFADDDGVVDISEYDFMATGASTVEKGSVNFKFSHLGALCRIRLNVPATAAYSYFVLESGDEKFSMTGCYDATDKNGEGISLVADAETVSQFKVLFPAENQSFEENAQIEFYFLMPPVDLTGQSLKFCLVDDQNNNCAFAIEPKNIVAGMTYSWDVNCLPKAIPLDSEGTANSYIVSEAGTYSFSTVKGNSSESVGAVSTAEVLWETYGTDETPEIGALVSIVACVNNTITFNASAKKGNAVISAKDANGKILWSWHIWMTDKPADQVYNNNAGTMMDRNLGAISTIPGDVGALGLMYQWGRKDPFLGSSSMHESIEAKSTLNTWPRVESTESVGTVEYTVANPTTFILSTYKEIYNDDWKYYSDNTLWQSTKTIYDPCPYGYRVPNGGKNGVWAKAFGMIENQPINWEDMWDNVNGGYDFGGSGLGRIGESPNWYPAGGYMVGGVLCDTGSVGDYWSCTPNGEFAEQFTFGNGYVVPFTGDGRHVGHSVRCFKENSAIETEPEPIVVTNLSADGTANCYIVSEEGTYKFSTVQGNSKTLVGKVVSAEVLWETYGTDVVPEVGALVSEVTYADNAITFKVSGKKGNAVIAARGADGTILWSWHIWMTDKPADQIYNNNAGTMMDRNLGATSATPGDVGALGLLYQWGRKDPFMGSSSISESIVAKSTMWEWPTITSDSNTGTFAFATAFPMVFITSTMNKDWCYSSISGESNNDGWQSVKTIYDPCPVGYRVPDGGEKDILATALNSSVIAVPIYDEINKGYNFGKGHSNSTLTEDFDCWYPYTGSLYHLSGGLSNVGYSGGYLSCTSTGTSAYMTYFDSPGSVRLLNEGYKAFGNSVRCCKENVDSKPLDPTVRAVGLSKNGMANSYIISEAGTYSFSTAKGNSNISVGAVASAEVLWESFGTDVTPNIGDLVYDVTYSDNAISFKASNKKGNAVIAAKDADGNILWSWHIWLTKKPKDQVYNNNGGTMMDRNLGATSTNHGFVETLGLMYQWGRKDPFVGSSSISESIVAKSTMGDWPTVSSTEENGTIAYAIANPTTFIVENSNNGDWFFTFKDITDNMRWRSTKTIYDPCPAGYRVPDGGPNSALAEAVDAYQSHFNEAYIYYGYDFGNIGIGVSLTEDEDCYYPAAGQINEGSLRTVGYMGRYWSCSPRREHAYLSIGFYIDYVDNSIQVLTSYPLGRASGIPVRCQKEE